MVKSCSLLKQVEGEKNHKFTNFLGMRKTFAKQLHHTQHLYTYTPQAIWTTLYCVREKIMLGVSSLTFSANGYYTESQGLMERPVLLEVTYCKNATLLLFSCRHIILELVFREGSQHIIIRDIEGHCNKVKATVCAHQHSVIDLDKCYQNEKSCTLNQVDQIRL